MWPPWAATSIWNLRRVSPTPLLIRVLGIFKAVCRSRLRYSALVSLRWWPQDYSICRMRRLI